MTDLPECLDCGACCFSRLATYVRVTGDDHARLGEQADSLVWFDGNRAYMRMAADRCSALATESTTGRLLCSTYATRPETCRELTRGLGACRGEHFAKWGQVLLAREEHGRSAKTPVA